MLGVGELAEQGDFGADMDQSGSAGVAATEKIDDSLPTFESAQAEGEAAAAADGEAEVLPPNARCVPPKLKAIYGSELEMSLIFCEGSFFQRLGFMFTTMLCFRS